MWKIYKSVMFWLYLSTNLVKINACEEEHQRDDDESVDLEAVGEHVGANDGAEDVCQGIGVLLDDIVQMLQNGSHNHPSKGVRQKRQK